MYNSVAFTAVKYTLAVYWNVISNSTIPWFFLNDIYAILNPQAFHSSALALLGMLQLGIGISESLGLLPGARNERDPWGWIVKPNGLWSGHLRHNSEISAPRNISHIFPPDFRRAYTKCQLSSFF